MKGTLYVHKTFWHSACVISEWRHDMKCTYILFWNQVNTLVVDVLAPTDLTGHQQPWYIIDIYKIGGCFTFMWMVANTFLQMNSVVKLTHRGRDKKAAILQSKFSDAYSWMESFVNWLKISLELS